MALLYAFVFFMAGGPRGRNAEASGDTRPTLPAYELLGELFMVQRRPGDALLAYRRSLQLYPRRFNGLLGAARAARASGDEALAGTFYQGLLEVAGHGSRAVALQEARRAVR